MMEWARISAWGVMVSCLGVTQITSCHRKSAARSTTELAEIGYQLKASDWFRAVEANDHSAVKHFLDSQFSFTTEDGQGNQALHVAARSNARDVAKLLLDRKAEIDVRGEHQRTPLMAAAMANQATMVRWLIRQGANLELKDEEGYNALMLASSHGKCAAIAELAQHQRGHLDNALLLACMENQARAIDTLTSYGASIYTSLDDGRTPLMIAAQNGHKESVQMLLDLGAARMATDDQGKTAIDFARDSGHQEIAVMILNTPKEDQWTLESAETLAKSVRITSHSEPNESDDTRSIDSNPVPLDGPSSNHAAQSPTLLEHQQVGASRVKGKTGQPADSTTASPPLVMRRYFHKELPLRIQSVQGDTATIEVIGKNPQAIHVKAGQTIPRTTMTVTRVERRYQSSKLHLGKPEAIDLVEVQDQKTGVKRQWLSTNPPLAHDPISLLEDTSTGHHYLATPGTTFQSADGKSYKITDVRPNQTIIEEKTTGTTETLPLIGPKG